MASWAQAEESDRRSVEAIERQAEADRARAEALREKAETLAEEVRALRAEAVAVAGKAQELEAELSRIEARLAGLEEEEAAKGAELDGRRAQLGRTLAALQRIAVQPPEALALAPGSPLDVVRGATVLSVAVPEIESRARSLRENLDSLASLRSEVEAQRRARSATAEALEEERVRLARLSEQRQQLRLQTEADARQLAERAEDLAREAADIRELVARLQEQAEERQALRESAPVPPDRPGGGVAGGEGEAPVATARLSRPEDVRAFPEQENSLLMPARGTIATRYGERLEREGGAIDSRGIVIETRPAAQVVAPFDGRVVYAGPFRGYGRILIIEHGGGYHSLLAGLERIEAVVGQWVLAGEPVGAMSEDGTHEPELYVELRRTGQPINPLPWLAQTGDKVRG